MPETLIMIKDGSPTLNIGMIAAKDGLVSRVKVVRNEVPDGFILGKRTDSSLHRVRVMQHGNSASLLFDHKHHVVEFPNDSSRPVKKRSGWYLLREGDVAVVSMKRKKDKPATNGAGQVYVIFDATTK